VAPTSITACKGQWLVLLLRHGLTPFQADFQGNTRVVSAPDDPLDFGTGSLFVRDPDGNLVEFLQMGRGCFAEDTHP
jgi:catechol 2,3-dioxygenase-like lactoylglutathione lyase family enzyme